MSAFAARTAKEDALEPVPCESAQALREFAGQLRDMALQHGRTAGDLDLRLESLAKALGENCSCAEVFARLDAVSPQLRDQINQRTGREAITPDRVRPEAQLLLTCMSSYGPK